MRQRHSEIGFNATVRMRLIVAQMENVPMVAMVTIEMGSVGKVIGQVLDAK